MNLPPIALLSILAAGLCWLSMAGLCARPHHITPPGRIKGLWAVSLLCLCCFIFFTGCTQLPEKRNPDGSVVKLGRTFMKKSATTNASWSNGTESLTYSDTGADETVVPSKAITSYTTLGVSSDLLGGLRTTESTKRVLGAQSVSKNATNKAAASTDLKTLNPVEVPAPAPAPSFDPGTGLNTVR
jgi:hypothetical protein